MKRTWTLAIGLCSLLLVSACAENTKSETVSDTIEAPLVDTVGLPTQGFNPDPGSLHVPDTMPAVDSGK